MSSKFLSEKAISVINRYKNFTVGSAVFSIPYYNNRHFGARARLLAQVGKGGPENILEEIENLAHREKVSIANADSVSMKKFLVDHDIGIDCSGFAYHILDAETRDRGKGTLEKHLAFPLCTGFMGILRAKLGPEKNTGVASLAHEQNSKIILLKDIMPGDMITMIGRTTTQRDHILIIHQIDYRDFIPETIYYSHSIAWPTDGEYGHGVRQGIIKIADASKPLIEQEWIENEKIGTENYTLARALKSQTEIRRLHWF